MIYITGDTHGDFTRIEVFCRRIGSTREDILIILGDAGINYYGGEIDNEKKKKLEALPVTLFCIHGNHEMRPASKGTYHEANWHGGTVYVEDKYPHLLFAKDGEIYGIAGQKTVVIGGAYSVDKEYRLQRGFGWWADEQPSDEIKAFTEQQLDHAEWNVDVVLSHTAPLRYEPTEMFLSMIDQSRVDKSTEEWLGQIEKKLSYRKWYCGHYHTDKRIDRLEFMFQSMELFYGQDVLEDDK